MRRRFLPYLQLMRLDRPIGIFLLLWPTLWGLWLASKGHPRPQHVLIFVLGTIAMRSAGCVVNDLVDHRFDKCVTRTMHRPLASAAISLFEAKLLFCALCLSALPLLLWLNPSAIVWGILAIMITIIYPFCKRFLQFPQLVLGIAFSLGIPMAFAATHEAMHTSGTLLFLAALVWPLIYDTQYAMVDKADDLKIGVRSTAILFGQWDLWILGALMILFLILLIVMSHFSDLKGPFLLAVLWAASLFVYQQRLIRDRLPENCFKAFLNNNWVGAILFLGMVFSF